MNPLFEKLQWERDEKLEPFWDQIFNGEYDVPVEFLGIPPVVLDIGANIGVYALWAVNRWPGAIVHTYEPAEKNFLWLQKNTSSTPNTPKALQVAVTSEVTPTVKIYRGAANDGCHSTKAGYAGQSEDFFLAMTLHPASLPNAHVVKIDTEGCEVDIITNYLKSHSAPVVISFEYHHRDDLEFLFSFMRARGYLLTSGHISNHNRGTLNYVHSKYFAKAALDERP